jgi:hypothetical protein
MQTVNWIDGRWCSASKEHFSPSLRVASAQERSSWPRSSETELGDALDALDEFGPAWAVLSRKNRANALGRCLDRWQKQVGGVDELALLLGLQVGALDDELERALDMGDELLKDCGAAGSSEPVLVRICSTQMYEGLVRAVFPALLDGASVLILSDPDLPWLSQELVGQLTQEPVLMDAVALLHDDRDVCLEEAIGENFFVRAILSEARDKIELKAKDRLEIQLQASLNLDYTVSSEADPELAAREVWLGAFDPVKTLSGQRAGQIGRVFCDERRLSEFTAALLERVDAGANAPTCKLFKQGLFAHMDSLCGLGLDEGATLLRGGPGEGAGFREQRRNAILRPSVLTNAEPTMGLVRATRPAPVLSIVRVSSGTQTSAPDVRGLATSESSEAP